METTLMPHQTPPPGRDQSLVTGYGVPVPCSLGGGPDPICDDGRRRMLGRDAAMRLNSVQAVGARARC
jgi:hypothetical protein